MQISKTVVTACAEQQKTPSKPAKHCWMLPDKTWSRIHIDHASISWNTIGSLSYTHTPNTRVSNSTSMKTTTQLVEENFSHFGYPHSLVSKKATTFSSLEFKTWCHERGIMTGAPYHQTTNGAAERLAQTFNRSLKNSRKPAKEAFQEFLCNADVHHYQADILPENCSTIGR